MESIFIDLIMISLKVSTQLDYSIIILFLFGSVLFCQFLTIVQYQVPRVVVCSCNC